MVDQAFFSLTSIFCVKIFAGAETGAGGRIRDGESTGKGSLAPGHQLGTIWGRLLPW
jgi:hypothetical protein